jgi:hypothetical protein
MKNPIRWWRELQEQRWRQQAQMIRTLAAADTIRDLRRMQGGKITEEQYAELANS